MALEDGPPPPPAPPGGGDGLAGGAGQAEEPAPSSSLLGPGLAHQHTSQQTRTYPCGNCGGELVFDIGAQTLKCPHCGVAQELAEVSGVVAEQDLRSAIAGLKSSAAGHVQAQGFTAGAKEITCQNCGANTVFTGSLTAQNCPYCTTPIQRDDVHAAPERLAVDGVLPFTIDKTTAEKTLSEWVSSRWFAPNEFKQYSRAGSFASVYHAYFTYDAQTITDYRGQRGDQYTVTVGSGENRRTETRIRWRHVAGRVQNVFDDVPVLANDGEEKAEVKGLEPWPTDQVKPFSAEFLAGHLSRTYDNDVEECFGEAQEVMEAEIDRTVRSDIGGDQQRVGQKNIQWGPMTFKHLLLPVWLLTVIYAGQTYSVAINGVTGQVSGERPYSKVKIAAAILVTVILIAIVVVLSRG